MTAPSHVRGESSPPSRWPISVAIIAVNEETNLARCLAAVHAHARDIVVVDSGSVDRTREIAAEFGARVIVQPWVGYAAQKNVALDACEQPWVLCLDADEVVSPELASAITDLFADGDPDGEGFEVSRRTWYLGDWIRHVWYPEWRLRLVRRSTARWEGDAIHERLVSSSPPGRLSGDLLHYTYRNLAQHFEKSVRYAEAAASVAAGRGRRFSGWRLLTHPPAAALRQLVLRQGWRDGWRGWLIAGATAARVFMREAFLFERDVTGSRTPCDQHRTSARDDTSS